MPHAPIGKAASHTAKSTSEKLIHRSEAKAQFQSALLSHLWGLIYSPLQALFISAAKIK